MRLHGSSGEKIPATDKAAPYRQNFKQSCLISHTSHGGGALQRHQDAYLPPPSSSGFHDASVLRILQETFQVARCSWRTPDRPSAVPEPQFHGGVALAVHVQVRSPALPLCHAGSASTQARNAIAARM